MRDPRWLSAREPALTLPSYAGVRPQMAGADRRLPRPLIGQHDKTTPRGRFDGVKGARTWGPPG
jgi:hypothetical protein